MKTCVKNILYGKKKRRWKIFPGKPLPFLAFIAFHDFYLSPDIFSHHEDRDVVLSFGLVDIIRYGRKDRIPYLDPYFLESLTPRTFFP